MIRLRSEDVENASMLLGFCSAVLNDCDAHVTIQYTLSVRLFHALIQYTVRF